MTLTKISNRNCTHLHEHIHYQNTAFIISNADLENLFRMSRQEMLSIRHMLTGKQTQSLFHFANEVRNSLDVFSSNDAKKKTFGLFT